MADRSSAYLFSVIFETLLEELPAGEKRDALAKRFWDLSRNYDFSDRQLECDDVLIALGLAHKGIDPEYPNDGAITIYEPPPNATPGACEDRDG